MNFIEECLGASKREEKVQVVELLFVALFFFSNIFLIIMYIKWKIPVIFLVLGIFVLPIIGFILGRKIGLMLFKAGSLEFSKSKLYKKLKKDGILNEYIDTINKEFDKPNTLIYLNNSLCYGILITDTWFTYVDNRQPKYVKTSDIIGISNRIGSNSTFFTSLSLINGENLSINHSFLEFIEKDLNIKFPNIKCGGGSNGE